MNKISVLLGGKTNNEQISKNNVHSVSGSGCREEGGGVGVPVWNKEQGGSELWRCRRSAEADGTVFQTDGTSEGDHDRAAFWVHLRDSRVANASACVGTVGTGA